MKSKITLSEKSNFNINTGPTPIENAICVFNFKNSTRYLNGSLIFNEETSKFEIKQLKTGFMIPVDCFDSFEYVLGEKGGFIWDDEDYKQE